MINLTASFGGLSVSGFFERIGREYFTPNLPKFENINITSEGFGLLVWALYFAFLLAALAAFYNRTVLGRLPRALIKNECISPQSAKTLSELGCDKNPFLRLSLRLGTTLRRTVRSVEQDEFEKDPKNTARASKFAEFWLGERKYKPNFANDHFYIPEEKRDSAAARFEKKGNGVIPLVLCAVFGIVIVALIMRFSPVLFEFIDGIVGGFKNDTNII